MLLGELRNACASFSYEQMVVDNEYLEKAGKMIALDCYEALTERKLAEMGREVPEDVNFRSVSRTYMELADIVFTDLRDTSAHCFNFPSDALREKAAGILKLICDLVQYSAVHLSMDSDMCPSQYRGWASKLLSRCEVASKYIEYDGKCEAYTKQMERLSELVSRAERDGRLTDLQSARNRRYLAENQKIIAWGRSNVEKLNLQLELCDPYDMTQRRYLLELINTTNGWLDGFERDH